MAQDGFRWLEPSQCTAGLKLGTSRIYSWLNDGCASQITAGSAMATLSQPKKNHKSRNG